MSGGRASRDKGNGLERWKPVPGFDLYEVSDRGRVRTTSASLKGERIRKAQIKNTGYLEVNLWDQTARKYKYRLVHRLVLTAFVGPCPKGWQGSHLDGDRANNNLTNLRWLTPKENESHKVAHGTKLLGERTNSVKLTEEQVRDIRRAYDGRTSRLWGAASLARRYGVAGCTITRVAQRTWWSHVG